MVADYILRLRQSIGGCLEDRTERCRRCLGGMQEGKGEYQYHKQNRAYEEPNFSQVNIWKSWRAKLEELAGKYVKRRRLCRA